MHNSPVDQIWKNFVINQPIDDVKSAAQLQVMHH